MTQLKGSFRPQAASIPTELDAAALDELERLALAATPGPWGVHEQRPSSSASVSGTFIHAGEDHADDTGFSLIARAYTRDGFEEWQRNAAFIAAANPATVLKLIAAIRTSGGGNE